MLHNTERETECMREREEGGRWGGGETEKERLKCCLSLIGELASWMSDRERGRERGGGRQRAA